MQYHLHLLGTSSVFGKKGSESERLAAEFGVRDARRREAMEEASRGVVFERDVARFN